MKSDCAGQRGLLCYRRVSNFGYSAMFFFSAACTMIYFVTATFLLPETKGKTLEEIDGYFQTAT